MSKKEINFFFYVLFWCMPSFIHLYWFTRNRLFWRKLYLPERFIFFYFRLIVGYSVCLLCKIILILFWIDWSLKMEYIFLCFNKNHSWFLLVGYLLSTESTNRMFRGYFAAGNHKSETRKKKWWFSSGKFIITINIWENT